MATAQAVEEKLMWKSWHATDTAARQATVIAAIEVPYQGYALEVFC
jgi:hypothetical protein